MEFNSEDVRLYLGRPRLPSCPCASALGGSISSGIGYPDPGGLRGNGSISVAFDSFRGRLRCIDVDAIGLNCTGAGGVAKDWPEEEVLRLDCGYCSGELESSCGKGGGDTSS